MRRFATRWQSVLRIRLIAGTLPSIQDVNDGADTYAKFILFLSWSSKAQIFAPAFAFESLLRCVQHLKRRGCLCYDIHAFMRLYVPAFACFHLGVFPPWQRFNIIQTCSDMHLPVCAQMSTCRYHLTGYRISWLRLIVCTSLYLIGICFGSCITGYQGSGEVGNCTDVDECFEGVHDCLATADCNNNEGSFFCTCKEGYESQGDNCLNIGK